MYVTAFSAWLNGDLTGSMEGETSYQVENPEVNKMDKNALHVPTNNMEKLVR